VCVAIGVSVSIGVAVGIGEVVGVGVDTGPGGKVFCMMYPLPTASSTTITDAAKTDLESTGFTILHFERGSAFLYREGTSSPHLHV